MAAEAPSTFQQQQQPSDGPKTELYKYSASSYTTKSNEEELFELVQLSGVPMDEGLFKVILELLKMNIAPTAILQILKTIKSKAVPEESSTHSSRQHSPASTNTQSSDVVLRHIKPDATGACDREQKSTTQKQCQLSEQKSSRSKTTRSAEKPGGKTEKHSSRHRSSSLKHKPSSGSSKPQSSSKM